MLFHALTIFLSAFLLFQVQPMIGKMILPWFGGTAAVWATCLLFFQAALLAGYGYSHGIVSRLTPRRQWALHSTMLVFCLLALPIIPNAGWKPLTPDAPALHILGLLAVTIGLPYFALSTTGPLIQAWYVQANPGKIPYRLFALSNLGSMLALLSYPPLVEPNLTLRNQALVWSCGFGLFAILCVYTGWRSQGRTRVAASDPADEQPNEPPPGLKRHLFWIGLAAGPSMLLLAVTSNMSMDIAPIPFLWILPLSLYLLSFILCFDAEGWYRRTLFLLLLGPALAGILYLAETSPEERPELKLTILAYSVAFFVACMVGHGELSRSKPHPRHLTAYYLMISIGGAIGGAFVALIAPMLFNTHYELPLACVLLTALALASMYRGIDSPFRRDWLGWASILVMTAAAAVIGYSAHIGRSMTQGSMLVTRNFYGELSVRQYNAPYDWDGYRSLVHGAINHGEQYTHPARRKDVASYYCADTGYGLMMQLRKQGHPQKIGVIGLGTGTLSGYSRPGDVYRYYEINPLVQPIANEYFWYLKNSEGQVTVTMGDARLSLEREPAQGFDVLVVDAFSSDSIPVHLLTREALEVYFRHMAPDGVIALHISNRFINLQPVLERAANALGKRSLLVETDDSDDGTCYGTTWVLMANRRETFDNEVFKGRSSPLVPAPWLRLWTDDYSNIYKVLK
ncbi:MAG TPA: fused MFS/spermidine synthase [Bryobacteraceae bacterium]|nr:fused MFS/spermidine synthase [Bryobacteraceae bacterium]HPT27568.1 fused MFS/spermidine synthase [Bryobacteraceae bacterium]